MNLQIVAQHHRTDSGKAVGFRGMIQINAQCMADIGRGYNPSNSATILRAIILDQDVAITGLMQGFDQITKRGLFQLIP